jgi:hypothetical protein
MQQDSSVLEGYIRDPAPSLTGGGLVVVTRVLVLGQLPVNPLAEQPALPSSAAARLAPVRSGRSYRITSPPQRGLVMPELSSALQHTFELFATRSGFSPEKPLDIALSRGFSAQSPGHREGRAADIASVGGKSLLEWKREWDRVTALAAGLPDSGQQAQAVAAARKANVGYGLYKALQEHGGWRADGHTWRPYRGVAQLFGPWTATEGPWKAMRIRHPTPYQRQRLADQAWVLRAHRDHIHVGR